MSNIISAFLAISFAGFVFLVILGFFANVAEFFFNIIKILCNKKILKFLAILILPIILLLFVLGNFEKIDSKLKTTETIRIHKKHNSEGLEIEYFDNVKKEKYIWN